MAKLENSKLFQYYNIKNFAVFNYLFFHNFYILLSLLNTYLIKTIKLESYYSFFEEKYNIQYSLFPKNSIFYKISILRLIRVNINILKNIMK